MEFISDKILVFFSLITSFIITYISIPSIIKVANQKNLFNVPNERTVHSTNIPTLGGLAIFAGVALSMLVYCNNFYFVELKYIIASTIIIFFIGIKDDILIIAPTLKFIGQIFAASVVVILADIRISNFHGFFGVHEVNYYFSIFFTIFLITAITNSFNLIDGIDGLSASIAILVAATVGIWFFLVGEMQYVIVAASLIGALLAFLRFNLFSVDEKIFMGDTGSLILGLLLSILMIRFNELNLNKNIDYFIQATPSVSFGILIVPVFDMMRVMFIRFFTRNPLFRPDKRHIHHKLLELKLSHKQAVWVLFLINVAFIIFAFWASFHLSIRRLILIEILFAIIIFYIPSYLTEKNRKKNK